MYHLNFAKLYFIMKNYKIILDSNFIISALEHIKEWHCRCSSIKNHVILTNNCHTLNLFEKWKFTSKNLAQDSV